MLRALLIILAIPVVLILVAAILLPLLVDKQKLLEIAEQQVHERTGATLSVQGDVGFSVLPRLGLSLGDVSVAMPGEEGSRVHSDALQIGVQLLPLFSGEVAVDSIALDGLQAQLVTQPGPPPVDTSKLNDQQLAQFYARRRAALEAAGEAAGAGAGAALAIPLALEVARLDVLDARLELRQAGTEETTVVEIPQLEARDLNLGGRPIPLSLSLRLPGDKPLAVDLDSRLSFDQDTRQLGIEQLAVQLRGALAQPLELAASGKVDVGNQVADLDLTAASGEVKAEGKLRYASFESPQIDTTLHLNRFTSALLAVAGPEAAAQAEATPAAGDGVDVPLPLGALRVMDTRADLSIDEVDWGGHQIHDLKLLLRVVDGLASLSRVTGEVHGGALSLKASVNAKQSIARIATQGSLEHVDIAKVLAASGGEPVARGTASLTWNLHGDGNTTGALRQNLAGPLELSTADVVVTAIGIEQKLCDVVALANQEQLSKPLPAESAFRELSAKVTLGNGKAELQPFTANLQDIGLRGKGELDLASLDFDARFNAHLSPGLEKLDHACRVNDRLTAIDWPVNCEGNVGGDPKKWCKVDAGSILKDLSGNELKRKAQKEVEKKFGKEAGDALKKLFGN